MKDLVIAASNTKELEIASSQYADFVERYRLFAQKTAENIIRLAETLYKAQDALAPVDFRRFCKEVELVEDGSTFKKLLKIGKMVSRFEPYVDRLPNAWTTVYKLATLENDQFERVAHSEPFSPFMTANDVTLVLEGPKAKATKKIADLSIDLSALPKGTKRDVYRELTALKQRFGFTLTANGEFKAIASDVDAVASVSDVIAPAQAT